MLTINWACWWYIDIKKTICLYIFNINWSYLPTCSVYGEHAQFMVSILNLWWTCSIYGEHPQFMVSILNLWWACSYSATEAKWCTAFVLLARLLSLSGCFIAHDTHVWSHTHHVLPIEANYTLKYGHRKLMKTKFSFEIKLW